jgi:hypothetical protein
VDGRQGWLQVACGEVQQTSGLQRLPGNHRAVAALQSSEPVDLGTNRALPNALDRLSRLDNIDKHRVPHAAWATFNVHFAPSVNNFAPRAFKVNEASTTLGPLENDAEIGRLTFYTPLPSEWEPTDMDVKRCFPLQVALGEPRLFQGALEELAFCLWGVEAVLTIFNPVFERGQPPLPVTAIAEPRG